MKLFRRAKTSKCQEACPLPESAATLPASTSEHEDEASISGFVARSRQALEDKRNITLKEWRKRKAWILSGNNNTAHPLPYLSLDLLEMPGLLAWILAFTTAVGPVTVGPDSIRLPPPCDDRPSFCRLHLPIHRFAHPHLPKPRWAACSRDALRNSWHMGDGLRPASDQLVDYGTSEPEKANRVAAHLIRNQLDCARCPDCSFCLYRTAPWHLARNRPGNRTVGFWTGTAAYSGTIEMAPTALPSGSGNRLLRSHSGRRTGSTCLRNQIASTPVPEKPDSIGWIIPPLPSGLHRFIGLAWTMAAMEGLMERFVQPSSSGNANDRTSETAEAPGGKEPAGDKKNSSSTTNTKTCSAWWLRDLLWGPRSARPPRGRSRRPRIRDRLPYRTADAICRLA